MHETKLVLKIDLTVPLYNRYIAFYYFIKKSYCDKL